MSRWSGVEVDLVDRRRWRLALGLVHTTLGVDPDRVCVGDLSVLVSGGVVVELETYDKDRNLGNWVSSRLLVNVKEKR